MANSLSFNQISTVLNQIARQVTGDQAITAVDTSSFVTVAQKTLAVGNDPVLNAINQIITRTIFSNRPYSRKFGTLRTDAQRYGAITRKINYLDRNAENNEMYTLVDGQSIDMYKVNKPKVKQYNFYGAETYRRSNTIFRDQLTNAFTGPDQLSEFLSGVTQNIMDQIEQDHESVARMTLANLAAGIYNKRKPSVQVVQLLTEYNALTGGEFTSQTIFAPDVFPSFAKWVFARIERVSEMLTERTSIYHFNVTADGNIMRHTPKNRQRMYMYTPAQNEIASRVLADVYHDNYLTGVPYEKVNFWQALSTDADTRQVNVTPSVLDVATGNVEKISDPVTIPYLWGILMDEETAGYTTIFEEVSTTPYNAAGGYWNTFYKYTDRYWNDFTENAVIFVLE